MAQDGVVIEMTNEENRMYEHLVALSQSTGSRIIQPYWKYAPRAKALYPRQTEEKAKGNFRGYVKHLIDLGILIRISEGRYFIQNVAVNVRSDNAGARGRRNKGSGNTFSVKRIANTPAHVRVQLLSGEICTLTNEIGTKQRELAQLTDLLHAIAGEL